MARAPDKRIEEARQLYQQGMKLVEIASQLNLPEGTVRRWKCTHKWDSERSDKNSERSEKKKVKKKKAAESEVDQVMENPDLTDKQRLFCIYYIRSFNATKAYQKAYGVDYPTAAANGPRMLGNARVKKEILNLKQERLNREFLSEADIFQKYMDIAFADMTDFVDIHGGFVSVRQEIDGSIVSEVSNTQSGIKIKLADRMKALQWLSDHMDLATDKQKAEIALLKAKVQTDDEEETADDGFLEALRGSAAEDWMDEEN